VLGACVPTFGFHKLSVRATGVASTGVVDGYRVDLYTNQEACEQRNTTDIWFTQGPDYWCLPGSQCSPSSLSPHALSTNATARYGSYMVDARGQKITTTLAVLQSA
jgi:hypothetical protein